MKACRISQWILAFFAMFLVTSSMAGAGTIANVTGLVSTTHTVGASSVDNVIKVTWTASTAPNLLGYATEWSNSSTYTPVEINLSSNFTLFESPPLSDGTWYFHIRVADKVGDYSTVSPLGPFFIDTSPEIISINPSAASNNVPTAVTILGTSFQNGASARIGDYNMDGVVVSNATTINATIPSGLPAGSYDIIVTNPNGKFYNFSATVPQQGFTVIPPNSSLKITVPSDTITVTSPNSVPLSATLTNTSGGAMNATWTVFSTPEGVTGSDYTLSGPTQSGISSGSTITGATFTASKGGGYTLRLSVTDNTTPQLPPVTQDIRITVNTANITPSLAAAASAVAGINTAGTLHVAIGTVVTVSGVVSDDGNQHDYLWTFDTKGNAATFANSAALTTTFTPATAGNYIASLTVTDYGDPRATSFPGTVTIKANAQPVVDAGPDQTVAINGKVSLAGSATDPNGATSFTYKWQFTGIPATANSNTFPLSPTVVSTAQTYSFTTAAAPGTYTLVFTADDGSKLPNSSASDTVVIRAEDNPAPVAVIFGGDQTKTDNGQKQTITLLGSTSSNSPEGQTITYTWTLLAKPNASNYTVGVIAGATAPDYTFTTEPGISGDYSIQLTVTEDKEPDGKPVASPKSSTATVKVTVSPAYKKGDVNGDGEITAQDAVDAFWLSFNTSWTTDQLNKADYNRDNEVTSQDAVDIFWASF